jgi:hypothetical protein
LEASREQGGVQIEEWLFNAQATPEERNAAARRIHGHFLKPGDVQRTNWRLRCAQPPYDNLPIPRADIPQGIILSREADAWIREDAVEDIALPLYEGRMIGQFDFSQKGWVSGKGRSAVWRDIHWDKKQIEPQFLMSLSDFLERTDQQRDFKVTLMDVTASTNTRTVIATAIHGVPCGHKTPILVPNPCSKFRVLASAGIFSSFLFDFEIRARLGGNSLIWSVLSETAVPTSVMNHERDIAATTAQLSISSAFFARVWLVLHSSQELLPWRAHWRVTDAARVETRARHDSMVLALAGLVAKDVMDIFDGCDIAENNTHINRLSKGFWRVDKDKDPELRHTVLTLIAFHDLEEKIRACRGDREKGIEAFLNQNNGEGWMLPETLRLADYGLGHDGRAKEHQAVASRLGPRFYDWQLAQTPEESWRECHIHARNLLGERGYLELLGEVLANAPEGGWAEALTFACELSKKENLLYAFETALGQIPPESWASRLEEARSIAAERGFTLKSDDRIQLLFGATRRVPEGKRQDALKACKALLDRDGLRTVVSRLLALEPTTPDSPWHTLLRESLDPAEYRALLAEMEGEGSVRVSEPSAVYDVTKMTQRRLFD